MLMRVNISMAKRDGSAAIVDSFVVFFEFGFYVHRLLWKFGTMFRNFKARQKCRIYTISCAHPCCQQLTNSSASCTCPDMDLAYDRIMSVACDIDAMLVYVKQEECGM